MDSILGAAHPAVSGSIVVGLAGYARSGKDSVAKVLIEEYGFTKFAFADKLREVLYALNPRVKASGGGYWHLQDAIDTYGWEGSKSSPYADDIRGLLQRMGTEAGRDVFGSDFWVRELDRCHGRIVVTDTRFPNEFERVKSLGGIMIRVTRHGAEPAGTHISETSLDNFTFDHEIINNGSLEELRKMVQSMVSCGIIKI